MDVFVVIGEFKQRLKALGYAEATVLSYGKNLDLFARYLQGRRIFDLKQVTHTVMLDYREKVMSEAIAMESKALKIRPVKRLFEFLVESHRLLINPAEGIVETSRKHRNVGTVLTMGEVERLLGQPDLSVRTQLRDRALMEVLYASGIRLDELLGLRVGDEDLAGGVLFVRKAKGKRQRVVPLGNACRYLEEYLQEVRPWHAAKNPAEKHLFLDHFGRLLRPEALRQAIRKYRLKAGIGKPVTPHTFRRTCATHLLQRGADIRAIQELLGHVSLATTHSYTKVLPVEVKQTHERTHPGKDL